MREAKEYYVTHKIYSVEEVAHDVFNRLLIFDQEEGTDYSVQFPETKISEILRKSLEVIKDKTGNVSEANRNQTLAAFGVIRRKGTKSLRLKIEAQDFIKISTREIKAKLRYSKEHFARVNELQKEQRYYFKFLCPGSYDLFFKALREKTYKNFRSELEAKLEE